MHKENDFVLITTVVFNEGNKDEYYKTYSGLITYESKHYIGFSKAIVHQIWKNHGVTATTSTNFSVDKISLH